MAATETFALATKQLGMTPQEQFLYQHHLNNLYGDGKVVHPDGMISTVYQTNVGLGGKQYNLPTVWDGRIVSIPQAIQRARQIGLDRFPSYATPEQAEQRYQQIHPYMEQDVQTYQAMQPKKFSGR